MREDGGLTIAKSVKFNVVEPDKDLPDLLPPAITDDLLLEPEGMDVLVTKEKLQEEIEFIAQKLLEKGSFEKRDMMFLFEKLEELGNTDFRVGKKTPMTSWYTGAYVHGGVAGLRANTKNFPNTTKYMTAYATKYNKGKDFTAVGVTRNSALGMHRDIHNSSKFSENMVLPISSFEGGGLWVEDENASEEEKVVKQVPHRGETSGRVMPLEEDKPVEFEPKRWHEVQPWTGDRVVMLMYTPRATKLSEADVEQLKDLGFKVNLESLREPEPMIEEEFQDEEDLVGDENIEIKRALLSSGAEEDEVFIEVTDEELFPGVGECGREHVQLPIKDPEGNVKLKKMAKKAEVQYTSNIEEILEDHANKGKPLEVTHTVSLSEVRKSISKWAPSAKKEYVNLVDNKKAFKPSKFKDLPAGCRIVPCKGVFTVKPDGNEEGFRRKTRFVACGNYLAEGELTGMDFDLYAAGLDSTSLRTMLAYRTTKPSWGAGVTDIRQAFVLAPWVGEPVALKPPALAVEMGLAAEDDYWLVLQSIYGLRELKSSGLGELSR